MPGGTESPSRGITPANHHSNQHHPYPRKLHKSGRVPEGDGLIFSIIFNIWIKTFVQHKDEILKSMIRAKKSKCLNIWTMSLIFYFCFSSYFHLTKIKFVNLKSNSALLYIKGHNLLTSAFPPKNVKLIKFPLKKLRIFLICNEQSTWTTCLNWHLGG